MIFVSKFCIIFSVLNSGLCPINSLPCVTQLDVDDGLKAIISNAMSRSSYMALPPHAQLVRRPSFGCTITGIES
jgi:hypothetical protein